jgi:hypothetical protein
MRTLRISPHLVALPLTELIATNTNPWSCRLCLAPTLSEDAALAHLRDYHACVPVIPATAL